MEFRGYQEESDSCSSHSDTALVIGSDSGFESDVLKLRTKSLEVSNTRQGQSMLVVPGYTILSSARPFSHNEAITDSNSDELQPEIHTRLHDDIRDNPSKVSFAKDTGLHQKKSIHHVSSTSPAYTIQASDSCSHMSNNEQSETDYLLGSNAKVKSKKGRGNLLRVRFCTTVMIIITVGSVTALALSLALLVVSINPCPISSEVFIDNQDTVLLNFFDTYYYDKIRIRKAQANECPDCKVEVYSFYPDNLIVGDKYQNVSSGTLTATHEDVLLQPQYYVSGSKIKMLIEFFPEKGQNSTVELVVFNDLHKYEAFRRGDKPIPNQVYTVQVNKGVKPFSQLVTITDTGYYFIGVNPVDDPITFQSFLTVHQIYYSRNDFPSPICIFDSVTDYCTVQFTPSSTDDYTDTLKMCVLVYSAPPQEVAKSYYLSLDYVVYRSFWTNVSKALLSLIGIVFLVVSVLVIYYFCSCIINFVRAKRSRNTYSK